MKIVCPNCGVDYQVEQVGVPAIDMFQVVPVPYRVRYGDLMKCPGCGNTVLANFGQPTEHHQTEFHADLQAAQTNPSVVRVYERVSDKSKYEKETKTC